MMIAAHSAEDGRTRHLSSWRADPRGRIVLLGEIREAPWVQVMMRDDNAPVVGLLGGIVLTQAMS